MHSWQDNARYRKWVLARDRALERLHTRAQLEAADTIRDMLTSTLLAAKSQFAALKSGQMYGIDWFETMLKQHFYRAGVQLYKIMTDLRARSYTLARASESEIIAQLIKKQVVSTVHHQKIHDIKHRKSFAGGELHHRIDLYIDRLRRRITSYAQAAVMQARDPDEFARDLMAAFPKPRVVKVPRRILRPKLMEAEGKEPKVDVAVDNIDEQAWNDMRDTHMNDYVPKTRAPEFTVGLPTKDGETWYAWEFEQDMTNEFVKSVRDGSVDAANENGITDFVWIAIIDSKTDACCLWRDGLLVSEIEAELDQHEDEDDECNLDGDGLTPPLHFSCRCALAPATDAIPAKPDDGAKDFEDWLSS